MTHAFISKSFLNNIIFPLTVHHPGSQLLDSNFYLRLGRRSSSSSTQKTRGKDTRQSHPALLAHQASPPRWKPVRCTGPCVLREGHPSTPHHGEGEEDPPHHGGEEEDHGVDPQVVGGLVGADVEVVNTVLTSTQMACC